MKIKTILILLLILSINKTFSQNGSLQEIEYKKIAEGIDSPIPDLQIVCFNKFFNKDYLPKQFREKYNLTDRKLFKKNMLVEIFHSDKNGNGWDKIKIENIREGDEAIIIQYDLINTNKNNDDDKLAPFLVLQIPKSKKNIRFIKNGAELGKTKDIYLNN